MLNFRFNFKSDQMKRRVWAGLCTAVADGSIQQYQAGAKHAVLAMVRAHEHEAEHSIQKLLSDYGWCRPEVTRIKLLDDSFASDDPEMLRCYKGAVEKDGGIIVYADPILEE